MVVMVDKQSIHAPYICKTTKAHLSAAPAMASASTRSEVPSGVSILSYGARRLAYPACASNDEQLMTALQQSQWMPLTSSDVRPMTTEPSSSVLPCITYRTRIPSCGFVG